MTNTEKVKHIRGITFSPINKINDALARSNGDIDAAVALLVKEKQADANEMANRTANTKIVYSYVHNNRIGAMIVLACQTDFVAKTSAFLNLAKNICMHIVSTPKAPQCVDEASADKEYVEKWRNIFLTGIDPKKPEAVKQKIVDGKMSKLLGEICLLKQPFVRDDTVTVGQLINDVSSTLGEKIEIKQFVKFIAQ